MMGGSREVRGLHGLAEFNIWVDPAAAAIVFGSGRRSGFSGRCHQEAQSASSGSRPWAASDSPLVRDVHESVLASCGTRPSYSARTTAPGTSTTPFRSRIFTTPGGSGSNPADRHWCLGGDETFGVTSIDFGPTGGRGRRRPPTRTGSPWMWTTPRDGVRIQTIADSELARREASIARFARSGPARRLTLRARPQERLWAISSMQCVTFG